MTECGFSPQRSLTIDISLLSVPYSFSTFLLKQCLDKEALLERGMEQIPTLSAKYSAQKAGFLLTMGKVQTL